LREDIRFEVGRMERQQLDNVLRKCGNPSIHLDEKAEKKHLDLEELKVTTGLQIRA
jgi:hypothetical protein